MKSEIGLIGLGVMGKSLALNMANKGYKLSLFNRKEAGIDENIALTFIAKHDKLKTAKGFDQLKPFIDSLITPRVIIIMITAGKVVDQVIKSIETYLQDGDVIIEGGNSHYLDTRQRFHSLKTKGIHFLGTGISGGVEGALSGPSIMPGGSYDGFLRVESLLSNIAAKDKNGNACMNYMGEGDAGHFVKTVHNGIEYAEMQIIAEMYTILRKGAGLNTPKIIDIFTYWLENGHRSYLLEITIDILKKQDDNDRVIDKIVDIARDNGTGSWSIQAASIFGVPVPTIIEALNARHTSFFLEDRKKAHSLYSPASQKMKINYENLAQSYLAARIINHHQGFHLIEEASERYDWNIKLEKVAQTWLNGCIIQSDLMDDISEHLKITNRLLNAKAIVPLMQKLAPKLAGIVSMANKSLLYIPCLSASLNYFAGFTGLNSSANLIQAQRDFFGAHKVLIKDDPSQTPTHINWSK